MHANGLMPLINKPTRLTLLTATLIDNIFTNSYKSDNHSLQGILTSDVSDHFAQFHIIQDDDSHSTKDQYQLIRLKNKSNTEKYIQSINSFDWGKVNQIFKL